jgi:hypothetical protein
LKKACASTGNRGKIEANVMWSVSITSTAYYGNPYHLLNWKLHARLWANGPQILGQWATRLSQRATRRGTMKSGLSHQAAAELSSNHPCESPHVMKPATDYTVTLRPQPNVDLIRQR